MRERKRPVLVAARFTQEERTRIGKAAGAAGLSIDALVRSLVLNGLQLRGVWPAGQPGGGHPGSPGSG